MPEQARARAPKRPVLSLASTEALDAAPTSPRGEPVSFEVAPQAGPMNRKSIRERCIKAPDGAREYCAEASGVPPRKPASGGATGSPVPDELVPFVSDDGFVGHPSLRPVVCAHPTNPTRGPLEAARPPTIQVHKLRWTCGQPDRSGPDLAFTKSSQREAQTRILWTKGPQSGIFRHFLHLR